MLVSWLGAAVYVENVRIPSFTIQPVVTTSPAPVNTHVGLEGNAYQILT